MRKIVTLIILAVAFNCYAQDYPYKHGVVGYGIGVNTFSNAYTLTSSGQPVKSDLTNAEFLSDRIHHSSLLLKVGYWDEDFYLNSEVSHLMSIALEFLRAIIKEENAKPQNTTGVGKLRKIGKNTNEDATGLGGQSDVVRADFGVGADGLYVGGIWGLGTFGLRDIQNAGIPGVRGSGVLLNAEESITMTTGLTIANELDTDIGKALIGTQISTIGMRYNGKPDLKRRGFESKSFIRLYTNDGDGGLYADAYYRFQRFKKFDQSGEDDQMNNSNALVLPKFITHSIGLNLGFYFN